MLNNRISNLLFFIPQELSCFFGGARYGCAGMSKLKCVSIVKGG